MIKSFCSTSLIKIENRYLSNQLCENDMIIDQILEDIHLLNDNKNNMLHKAAELLT